MMKERLHEIREKALAQINSTDSLEKLNEVRVSFLGKKGELTEVQSMKDGRFIPVCPPGYKNKILIKI